MMIAKHHGRLVALILVASMLVQMFGGVIAFAETVDDTTRTKHSLDAMADLMVSTTYSEYKALYEGVPNATQTVEVDVLDPMAYESDPELSEEENAKEAAELAVTEIRVDPENPDKEVLFTPGVGKISYKIEVPETAMYTMSIRYYPVVVKAGAGVPENNVSHGSNIERIFMIDGAVPFKEARYLTFSRIWQDNEGNGYDYEKREFRKDYNGNEMRPTKSENPHWVETEIYDTESFFTEPLQFYLEAGEHVITLDAACEPMLIDSIKFGPAQVVETYEQYLAKHADKKVPANKESNKIMIHAETPYQTSEQVIYAMNDRTSGITYPQDPAASLLNTIGGNGGDKWKISGQWISYQFEITEPGMYEIVPRFKQTINQGLFSSRALKIDGEYPFAEAKKLQFKYGDDWQVASLNDGVTESFMFYFDKGTHTIEFRAVLGDMADILNTIEDSQTRLNDYYRKILMITGSEPDEYTDYEFAKLIPDVLRGMRDESKLLTEVSAELEAKIGSKGSNTVILDRIAYLLDLMGNDQDKIASNLGNYKSYIGSLGTWLLSTKGQPLQLDYILVQPAGSSLPRANATFFESMSHEFKSFVMSFFTDYNSLGASKKIDPDDPNSIEVWVTTGRDQATIMRQMIDDSFNNEDVSVNLKLIAAGTLLPATLAGVGPDVSMDADAIGLGIRNAVIPVNYFDGFEQVKEECYGNNEELFVHLTILDPDKIEYVDGADGNKKEYKVVNGVERNGVVTYGLPSTIDFPMLFYRKDIFVDLGLDVPETWDDVEGVIRALSENEMEMGLGQAMHQIYMYQTGYEWFKSAQDFEEGIDKDSREYLRTVGIATNLDTNGALDAFQRMTEWFTLYGMPVTFDFANRFRTGEMPIAIAAYSSYNQLKVFAPEIAGLWEFVQLPGVEQEDGTINHTTPGTPHSLMLMKDAADDIKEGQDVTESKKAQNSWSFLKWWMSTPTQERFGQEQVAIMGTAAKYTTANVEALIGQSWTAQEKENLMQQFKSLKGTPMSPGNYIVARFTNFAFYNVVDDGKPAADAMLGYVDDINQELSRKRDEYGFLTLEEYKEELKAKGIEVN